MVTNTEHLREPNEQGDQDEGKEVRNEFRRSDRSITEGSDLNRKSRMGDGQGGSLR